MLLHASNRCLNTAKSANGNLNEHKKCIYLVWSKSRVEFLGHLLVSFAVVLCGGTKCGWATLSLNCEKHIFVIVHTTISTVLNVSDTIDPVVTYLHKH